MGDLAAGTLPQGGQGPRMGCKGKSPYGCSLPPSAAQLMLHLQMFPHLEGATRMLKDGL